jgi:hypothetical protein
MENSFEFLVYMYFMWCIIYDLFLLIFGTMLMNFNVFFQNKQDLDKHLTIQKNIIIKCPNKIFYFSCVILRLKK